MANGVAVADELERLIIDVVQRYPVLYDRAHKFHNCASFPDAHQDAWRHISDEMRLEVGSCKSLWMCIKQKFIKYRKRIATGDAVSKEWPLYDVIYSWLDEHVQKRRSRVQICKMIRNSTDEKVVTSLTRLISQEHQDLIDSFDTAEFTELPDNKPVPSITTPQQSISAIGKRKSSTKTFISAAHPKRKMKIEIINDESDSTDDKAEEEPSNVSVEIAAEHLENPQPDTKSLKLDTSNNTMETSKTTNGIEPILGVSTMEPAAISAMSAVVSHVASTPPTQTIIDFGRLESVISQCVGFAEKCALRQRTQDPDEVFGTLIASMVRELPIERRRSARVQILEMAGDLLAKMA